jgi:hypothetical protein
MRFAGSLLLVFSTAASAQWPGDQKIPPVSYPKLPKHAASVAAFVPKQWKLTDKAIGDLNGDRIPDAALAIWMDDPRNRIHPSYDPKYRYDTNPMMLIVLLGSKSGGFDLVTANHDLIPRRVNPNQDPPFHGVNIANGVLRVKMHEFLEAGGWWLGKKSFAFRWRDGALRLIGYDRDGIIKNTGDTEVVSINYPALRMVVTKGTMSGEEPGRTETVTLPKKPLLTLAEVGDGLMFEPDEH